MDSSGVIAFFGDPHGDFRAVASALAGPRPGTSVFVGDFDLEFPFAKQLEPLAAAGSEVWYVHGNHDTDRDEWHDRLFECPLGARRNLNARVVEASGLRIAGLGGVFREKIWHPRNGDGKPRYSTRDEFMRAHRASKWRGGLPRGHRSSVFWEDFEALDGKRADVLVTHEAPSCHRYGFEEIDFLAEMLGVKLVVHGHHHERYDAVLPSGVQVLGLGKADLVVANADDIVQDGWAARAAAA